MSLSYKVVQDIPSCPEKATTMKLWRRKKIIHESLKSMNMHAYYKIQMLCLSFTESKEEKCI